MAKPRFEPRYILPNPVAIAIRRALGLPPFPVAVIWERVK